MLELVLEIDRCHGSTSPDPSSGLPTTPPEPRARPVGRARSGALAVGVLVALVVLAGAILAGGTSARAAMPPVLVDIWPESEDFRPSVISVTTGTTFTWVNERSTTVTLEIFAAPNTPTATPDPSPGPAFPARAYLPVVADGSTTAGAARTAPRPLAATPPFGPQTLAPGASFSYTFDRPGTFALTLAEDSAATGSVAVLATTPTPVGTAPSYLVVDLGTPFGTSAEGLGINDNDQQVGFSGNSATNTDTIVLWSRGTPISLNAQSPAGNQTTSGQGVAINQNGVVLATYSGTCSTGPCGGAFLDQNGAVTPIPYDQLDYVYGLNDQNQVVGMTGSGGGATAAVWQNGTLTLLAPVGGTSYATAINDLGQAVGPGLYAYGYLWQNGTATNLGTFGGCSNTPWAINNGGQIVGTAQTGGSWEPCKGSSDPYLWQNGTLLDLGLAAGCSGAAYAINNEGAVVGDCGGSQTFPYGAFLWQNGRMEFLDALIPAGSGWTISVPRGIDDAGNIIASATYQGQTTEHAVLLVPN